MPNEKNLVGSGFEPSKLSFVVRYILIPFVTVFLAVLIKQAAPQIFGGTNFLLIYTPIIISATLGGAGAGCIAIILSIFALAYFIYPNPPVTQMRGVEIIQLGIFLLESAFIVTVIEFLHRLTDNIKKATLALQTSKDRYSTLMANITDYAIFMMDKKGRVESWNEGARNLLGFSDDEIYGKNFSRFFIPQDRRKDMPQKELATAKVKGRSEDENWVLRKDKTKFWGSGVTMSVYENGKFIGFEKIVRDMTKQKELQESKDDFISVASHEMRTPVTSIKTYMEVLVRNLKKRKEANKPLLDIASRMEAQLEKLSILIRDLLDVSRIDKEKLEIKRKRSDLTRLVEECVSDMRLVASDHKFLLNKNGPMWLYIDPSRIMQVIDNLLTNAIKYSPKNTKIIVGIQEEGKNVLVSVRDYGVGISEENQKKIFDRFFRVREKTQSLSGLGLGLYIAYQIIKEHLGNMWVESKEGKGSVFYFSLPKGKPKKLK